MNNKVVKRIVIIMLLAWFGVFLCQYIDLTRTDIGRHLKNGELLYRKIFSPERSNLDFKILNTNFYSYSNPDFPVVNHHWGSGLVFYVIHKVFGFKGLSIFYIIISFITFLFFFNVSEKGSNFIISLLAAVLLIPVMAERREIRPELFSYLFSSIFLWVIYKYKEGSVSKKMLFSLAAVEVVWVNMHIYFIFGIFIIAAFIIEDFAAFTVKKANNFKELAITLFLIIIAAFINPFGIKGVVYPFSIFGNYGYKVVENQSVQFLQNYGIANPNFLLFKITIIALLLSFILILIINRRKFSVPYFLIGTAFSIMAWFALRNFTIFAFFALPILSMNFASIFSATSKLNERTMSVFLFILSFFIFSFNIYRTYKICPYYKNIGIGLAPGNALAAEFFIKENIQGPILNNYDIGGYLIYHLFPMHRVFVDNRPEAYPADFFQKIYIPLQENSSVFKEQEKAYKFNCIFFSHWDITPWGQKFLIERVSDREWAPVFADGYSIIFVKRNKPNIDLIDKYEVPKSMFSVVGNK
jgi:hypothetical protein